MKGFIISKPTSPPDDAQESATGTGTVVRVVRLLGALSEVEDNISLGELAGRVGLPASTVHRLLDLLAGEGMVERNDALRMYRPGLEFFRMASSIYNRMPIHGLALPFLREAVADNNENAYLGMLDLQAGKMLFAAVAESNNLLSYRVTLNEMLSLVRGASGLAMLAWMNEADRDRVLEADARVPGATRDRDGVLRELAVIRERGFAQTFGEKIPGAVGIFAPVFNAQSRVIGSFGYTVPEMRYQPDYLPRLSGSVMRHAGALSKALGWRDPGTSQKQPSPSDRGSHGRPTKNRTTP